MTYVTRMIPLLVLLSLIPSGLAFAESEKYTLEEITHAFTVMEQYTVPDEHRHLQIDWMAHADPNVHDLDIEIVRAFAVHNDEMMSILAEATSDENMKERRLRESLQKLENGKFSALFSQEHSQTVHTMSTPSKTPILSTFGIQPDTESVTPVIHVNRGLLIACRGGPNHAHPAPTLTTDGQYATRQQATDVLLGNGYHRVADYASLPENHGFDYAKITSAYGCSNGEFRIQSIVVRDPAGFWFHNSHSAEPNPEVLAYLWPSLWWGPYVMQWHDRY